MITKKDGGDMRTLTYILSFAIGFAICMFIRKPEVIKSVVIETKETIDTVFYSHIDTVWIPYETLIETIDTVYYSEPFKADISRYTGIERVKYGTINWSLETTGKLTNLSIIPHMELPTITHKIETVKTVTTVKDLRGLYAGAGISDRIDYKLGASYVDKSWQFNYDYQPKDKIHWVGVKRRLF